MRSKLARYEASDGDLIAVGSPGGGGLGDPSKRPPDEVLGDLNLGYISRSTAEDVYGAQVVELPAIAGRPRYRLQAAPTPVPSESVAHGGPGVEPT
jgi:N-methylhydantoinase B/oxoprolinase/acetone carboxylase alpha subunit